VVSINKIFIRMGVGLTFLALLAGCESRVSQCGKIQQVITKEKEISSSVSNDKIGELPDKLDAVTTELEAVKVGDGNLQNRQKNLVDNYKNLSQSIRNIDAAIGKTEVNNIKIALRDLEYVTDQKKSFIEEINKYCMVQ
jgi:hypothetical protein